MDFIQLLTLQFIAHLLTDYTFQNDEKATDKNKKGFKSSFLKWHILTMFICSWLLSFQVKFIVASLIIALTHWIIDGFKPKLNKNRYTTNYAFFIDQFLHLTIIYFVVLIFSERFDLTTFLNFDITLKQLFIFTAFLVTTKPANILIREVFNLYQIKVDIKKDDELLKAGRLIGILERWLILIFVLVGQFQAVGFLIAAKSILRYSPKNDDGFNKTEYVLIGTMLSFGIAITVGVICLNYC